MQKATIFRQACSHLFPYNIIAKGFSAILWIVMVTLLIPMLATSGDIETNNKNSQIRQLSELSNDALIEQARTIFDEASNKYLAQLRKLSTCNNLLQQAVRETKSLNIPKEEPATPPKHMFAVEAAKMAINHSKIRLDAFKQRLELLEKEKSLWEKKLSQIDAVKLAANHFHRALEKLNLFLFEIELRIKDGTFRDDQVPEQFNVKQINIQNQELRAKQNALKMIEKASLKEAKIISKRIQEGKKAVIAFEAYYFSVQEEYAKALKALELKQEYSDQPPMRLAEYLTKLQKERAWFDRMYHRAKDQFNRIQTHITQMQNELEKLSALEEEHPPEKVIELMNLALGDCKTILQDQDKGTILSGLEVFEQMTMMKYWPWWSVDDYHKRYRIRSEVWNSIWKRLSEAGIEMKANPFELKETAGFKDLLENGKT